MVRLGINKRNVFKQVKKDIQDGDALKLITDIIHSVTILGEVVGGPYQIGAIYLDRHTLHCAN